ncbi:MAG: flagellar motor protein MotA [Alphaproteobacteria bacterium]
MTRPRRYLVRMGAFLLLALLVIAGLHEPLIAAFETNPALNGLIILTLVVGIVYVLRQVWRLDAEVAWVDAFRSQRPGLSVASLPQLLGPMARLLGDRGGRLSMSATTLRSLLDGLAARLDEGREISRYIIGLLIFLGLLGTFWGLLETIRAVADVIGDLDITGDDAGAVLGGLISGLEAPLSGMGTAFSSSLFGLAGSLLLGFLDLSAGQAQNRFYNEVEEWLSGVTRLGGAGPVGDGDTTVPAYIQALLETTADSLDNLQRTIAQGEESRANANVAIAAMADRLAMLTDRMKSEQELMGRLVRGQTELRPVLERLAEAQSGGFDEATRNHIRNVDVHLARLVEDQSSGRAQLVQELRSEIRLLARTIAALADGER